MKRLTFFALIISHMLTLGLFADQMQSGSTPYDQVNNSLPDNELQRPWQTEEFRILANYTSVFNTRVHGIPDSTQNINYNQWESSLLYNYQFSPYSTAVFGAGYYYNRIHWAQNPAFSTQTFNYINFTIGGLTKAVERWLFQAGFTVNLDPNNGSIGQNSWYNGMAWARYSYSPLLGVNLGFIGMTGLKKNQLLPIFGIDYQPSDLWAINLIFPVDISATYTFAPEWSLSVSSRRFLTRHRLNYKQATPRGIMEYHSYGAEVGLNYTQSKTGNLFHVYIGSTAAGALLVSGSDGKNPEYYKFRFAPYIGADATINF